MPSDKLRQSFLIFCFVIVFSLPIQAFEKAETKLQVVVDIPPLFALVRDVMKGAGEPVLLIDQQVSPHDNVMRPSKRRLLSKADLVFWIGPELSPWLKKAISVAGVPKSFALLNTPGIEKRFVGKDLLRMQARDHHHGANAGHDHGDMSLDPHAWLNTRNAVIWVKFIADTLIEADPKNAQLYAENQTSLVADLKSLTDKISLQFESATDAYMVDHDAFGYFEQQFGLKAEGIVNFNHATNLGAKRLRRVIAHVEQKNVQCIFIEPFTDTRRFRFMTRKGKVKLVRLDAFGLQQDGRVLSYQQTLNKLAQDISNCSS